MAVTFSFLWAFFLCSCVKIKMGFAGSRVFFLLRSISHFLYFYPTLTHFLAHSWIFSRPAFCSAKHCVALHCALICGKAQKRLGDVAVCADSSWATCALLSEKASEFPAMCPSRGATEYWDRRKIFRVQLAGFYNKIPIVHFTSAPRGAPMPHRALSKFYFGTCCWAHTRIFLSIGSD